MISLNSVQCNSKFSEKNMIKFPENGVTPLEWVKHKKAILT